MQISGIYQMCHISKYPPWLNPAFQHHLSSLVSCEFARSPHYGKRQVSSETAGAKRCPNATERSCPCHDFPVGWFNCHIIKSFLKKGKLFSVRYTISSNHVCIMLSLFGRHNDWQFHSEAQRCIVHYLHTFMHGHILHAFDFKTKWPELEMQTRPEGYMQSYFLDLASVFLDVSVTKPKTFAAWVLHFKRICVANPQSSLCRPILAAMPGRVPNFDQTVCNLIRLGAPKASWLMHQNMSAGKKTGKVKGQYVQLFR